MNAVSVRKEIPVVNEVPTVFASKSGRGFHPCDYATYVKLRKLHGFYWKTVQKLSSWLRWNAKEPQNRVHVMRVRDENKRVLEVKKTEWNEPAYCPIFGTSNYRRSFLSIPKHLKGEIILEAYEIARMPKPVDAVKPLPISINEIEKLYKSMTEWQENN